MRSHDYRDIIGGGLLAAFGLFFAVYGSVNYRIGSFAQMGPGMLPLLLGIMLAGIGMIIAVMGLFRSGTVPQPDIRSLLAVICGIVAFALVTEWFGMVPAVVVLTVASALADKKLSPMRIAGLTAVLVVIAVGAFHFGLGIRMPLFDWPF